MSEGVTRNLTDVERRDAQAVNDRTKMEGNIPDISLFFEVLHDAFNMEEIQEQYPDLQNVKIAHWSPKFNPDHPGVIVYIIIEQQPAVVSSPGNEPFVTGGREVRERRHRFRESSVRDPHKPGYSVDIAGRGVDALLRFDICSTDAFGTNRIVRSFIDFMDL